MNLIEFVLLPVRIVTRLVVVLHAWLFWPFTTQLTGRPVRLVSLRPTEKACQHVRESILAYYAAHGGWPETYADLDPYGVLETTCLRSVDFVDTGSGALDVKIFTRYGKGRFRIDPPGPNVST